MCAPCIQQWNWQRIVAKGENIDSVKMAFSCFFLHKTSGVGVFLNDPESRIWHKTRLKESPFFNFYCVKLIQLSFLQQHKSVEASYTLTLNKEFSHVDAKADQFVAGWVVLSIFRYSFIYSYHLSLTQKLINLLEAELLLLRKYTNIQIFFLQIYTKADYIDAGWVIVTATTPGSHPWRRQPW